jgi:glycogen debranching enzyme
MNQQTGRARSLAHSVVALCFFLFAFNACAQRESADSATASSPALETQAVVSRHFIAAHGTRSIIQGYAGGTLEVWAYPFQILSGYQVAFRAPDGTTAVDGKDILSRIVYDPDSVTRVYIGPNFIVHEKLFVSFNQPGAILTYTIEGNKSIQIDVHASPIMNLMWPAGVGGQSVEWNSSLSAYVLAEPLHGYTATVGSPDLVAHDAPTNSTTRSTGETGIGFTLHPNASGIARLYVALNPPHATEPGTLFHTLIQNRASLEAESAAYFRDVRANSLQIETPDTKVNEAIAWAKIALEQAWVCNPDLGCAFVAGYGPSRAARRPQYEWFFAGDGLVSTQAAVDTGDLAHAREELEFILRYQDSKTGMIWHELSQSASFIDWAGKYPYMFVHVDITFQFLGELSRYVETTGDLSFVRDHWSAIESAYSYCRSVIDPKTNLPYIPPGKEGGDEQDRMSDDLGLSAAWAAASDSFAKLATLTGHADLAAEAAKNNQLARAEIPARYWDASQSFWITGHTIAGQKMEEHVSGPGEALTLNIFNPQQTNHMLDELASSSFQTDWGTRSIAVGSAGFDPESYGKGSVWPLGTAGMASTFWSEHRPVTALAVWQSLLPLASLDSPGHFPEVMAGNFYRPQIESVPEQTWSSAGFLSVTIHGLLGIDTNALHRRLTFAPRVPASWNDVSIQRIQLGGTSVSLVLHREASNLKLIIDNPGDPFKLEFSPDLPLGATVLRASFNHQATAAKLEEFPQQSNATVIVDAPHGKSELQLDWQGGISIIQDGPAPQLGDASSSIHIVDVHFEGKTLILAVDVPTDRASRLRLKTPWRIAHVEGATLQPESDGLSQIIFAAAQQNANPYRRANAVIEINP